MPNLLPQYAFSAGEISREFFGRTDLVKYSLGAQYVYNFYVGLRGGLYSRAGSRFVGEMLGDSTEQRIIRFRATANDYLLILGHQTMRFVRDGGYLLEASQPITAITSANPAVLTAAAHGYSTGDWVYITGVVGLDEVNSRYLRVGATTANTLELQSPDSAPLDTTIFGAYTSGGVISRVYTIATTWASSDLRDLRAEQEFNDVTFTHLSYPPRRLSRVSDTNWTLTDVSFGGTVTPPAAPTLTPSGGGSAGIAFAVSAVVDGVESLASPYTLIQNSVDYTATAGSLRVAWDPISGATQYNVYRSLVLPAGGDISLAQEVGYLGKAYSGQFTDNNIIPDFLKTPPLHINPFEDGTITQIDVTAQGAGYPKTTTVSVAGGTGFSGYPVVNSAGRILSVIIVNGGAGYSSPVVSFIGAGTGATATALVGPTSGNYPRVYRKFQQRGLYGGSLNYPMTIWGSKVSARDNFDVGSATSAGDAYTLRLDASVVKPILHLHALRSGILAFTEDSVTRISAAQGAAVTGTSALAEPQLYNGVGAVASPVSIGLDVLFPQRLGQALNVMEYTIYTNSFNLRNLSTLAHHLLGVGQSIVRMEYAESPDKLLYCLREDGVILTLTYDRNEQVYGWAQHETQGFYDDTAIVVENNAWVLYTVVRRLIGGVWRRYLERTLPREAPLAEDFWCVDSGLSLTQEYPGTTLNPAASIGLGVAFITSANTFVALDVGKIIYVDGGKALVTAYVSPTEVTCAVQRTLTELVAGTAVPKPAAAGAWSMAFPVSSVTNLWHLEGETVSVLADGNAYKNLTVTGGSVTWAGPSASKVVVGLPYSCRVKTLPIATQAEVLESRRKDILGAGLRVYKTRGLSAGEDFANQIELKDRGSEDWGNAITLKTKAGYVPVNTGWAEDGSIALEQSYPLPAAILSLIYNVEPGDT